MQQGFGGRPVSPRCQNEVALAHMIESGEGCGKGVADEAS